MTARIISVDPCEPGLWVEEAAALLRKGGIIAYPTETFYGLGVDGTNEAAVERIFEVKGRDSNVPVSLIIGDLSALEGLVRSVPEAGRRIADAFWPGAVTIVFEAAPDVPEKLTAGTGKIGVRLTSHPVARAIARQLGRALTATRANRSGAGECLTAQEVFAVLGEDLDAVVDGGRTPGPPGSTIVDVTVDPPKVLREGANIDGVKSLNLTFEKKERGESER